jgi:hypothetical protein
MIKKENVVIISAAIFTVVAFAHLLRIILRFDLSVGEESISLWVNAFGALVAGYLAVANFRLVERASKIIWLKFVASLAVADGLITLYSWLAGLSYWGISRAAFGWITIFDIAVVLVILYFIKKSSAQAA